MNSEEENSPYALQTPSKVLIHKLLNDSDSLTKAFQLELKSRKLALECCTEKRKKVLNEIS